MEADLPVKEIMTRDVVVGSEYETLFDAATKMVEKEVGSIVVVQDDKPVGIVTERDILEKVVAKNLKSKEVYLKDVMSTPVFSISPNISVRVAADQMVRRNIRRLPVVENGRLVGIVTDTDLISVSLDLNEVLYAVIGPQEEGISSEGLQGLCDKCGQLVEELFEVEGMLLCGSCADNFQ